MKKIYKIAFMALLAAGTFTACQLDEWNPSSVDTDKAFTEREGFESLLNYCYDGLYYLYGKVDGAGVMEMGTDIWCAKGTDAVAAYNSSLNTSHSQVKTLWESLYATVNYCNTAIYYADHVTGYSSPAELEAKIAEAYFLRGWSNWHLVEQFGGVTLRKTSSAIVGSDPAPKRNTEVEFYDLVISDLKYATQHLPLTSNERGRATRKAAYAMLAKAYLQRTRLNEPEASEYARLALEAAKELIDNQNKYGIALYQSDAVKSGFAKLWSPENNKNNTEYLFLEAVDVTGINPENANRGRTWQYYAADMRQATDWGTTERDSRISRTNAGAYKPTKYLLTKIFEPVENPADTRFAESFYYEYYNCGNQQSTGKNTTITETMINTYGKDASLEDHVILNTMSSFTSVRNGTLWATGLQNMVDNDGDGYLDGLSLFTPNWTIAPAVKAKLPFLVVDPSDQFQANGKWVEPGTGQNARYKELYPSMSKFSRLDWVGSIQEWMGDIPIIRLGEIYLVAAEAALRYNNDQATALTYVNEIRKRAAVTGRQNDMLAKQADMTLDYILAERARELAGEQVRWYDLKRMGKLTKAYLGETNPDITEFNEGKHILRPIPQSQLDATINPDEYGTNGY